MMIPPTSFAEALREAEQVAGSGGPRARKPEPKGLGEREQFLHAIPLGDVDLAVFAELAFALRAFARSEVAQAGFAAHEFARPGHFDALNGGFFRLATCNGSRHGAAKVAGEVERARGFLGIVSRGADVRVHASRGWIVCQISPSSSSTVRAASRR